VKQKLLLTVAVLGLAAAVASANERRFTYTYEPEVLPAGALEFEQWITLRSGRGEDTGKAHFSRWELREEFEYGVTDRYTASLYLNARAESYETAATGASTSTFKFRGVSLENRYLVLNPAEKPVGLTLYLEPTYSGEQAKLEEKIIFGQRHGDWKWAVNLTHETEWELHDAETVGEFDATFGLTRQLGKRWAIGIEGRVHSEIAEYKDWEHLAVFVGPVVSYARDEWWAAVTVLPQVYGKNYGGDTDGHSALVLDDHERVEIRVLFGIGF
jgi:hypothetical protein